MKPQVLILDSVQTVASVDLESSAGTVGQIRECTLQLMELAKKKHLICILVGHITKEGEIAGPKLLEHMVDVVLQFEGDKNNYFRLLRANKNRFGSTDEVGIFEMGLDGLVAVKNPAAYFLDDRDRGSGSALSVILEGNQPFLLEIQALVTRKHLPQPRRTAMGLELNRLNLLLAILEKHLQISFVDYDVCVNLAGGLKSTDPSLDLALIVAILSSLENKVFISNPIVLGEVGLGGEIRMIPQAERRIREASLQGLKTFLLPDKTRNLLQVSGKAIYVKSIQEVGAILEEKGLSLDHRSC